MPGRAAGIVTGSVVLVLALSSPCVGQDAAPSFADSASVVLLVGEDLGRVYGRVGVTSSIHCASRKACEWAPSGPSGETASLELLETLRMAIDRGATGRWGEGMPVIGPQFLARIEPPRFPSSGDSSVVRVDLEDPAWGQSLTVLYFLEREGEGWRIVEDLGGRGRIWPLPGRGGR